MRFSLVGHQSLDLIYGYTPFKLGFMLMLLLDKFIMKLSQFVVILSMAGGSKPGRHIATGVPTRPSSHQAQGQSHDSGGKESAAHD